MATRNRVAQKVRISRSENTKEGRTLGLGDVQSSKSCQLVVDCPISRVPVLEYVTWTTTVGLSTADVESTFGDSIDPMQNQNPAGILSVDSSFIINGLLQLNMLTYGIGVHIFGEPFSFTVEGNSISSAATAPIASLDVFTNNDVTNDAMGNTEAGAGAPVPAVLEWGFASWMAAWHMSNAYELNWWFCQRYTLIKELLADVSYFGPYADSVAAGTSQVSAQQFFQQVNAHYLNDLGSAKQIQPIGFRRVGSVTVSAANVASVRPTRDFDLVDVTYGGLRNNGGGGCCTPFRKFDCPVLLETGKPIGLKMAAVDDYHHAQMQRYLAASEMGSATPALISFGGVGGLSTAGGANTALEQTLDSSPVNVAQRTQTDRELYKGGAFKVALMIKGLEVGDDALASIRQAASAGMIANGSMGVGRARLS